MTQPPGYPAQQPDPYGAGGQPPPGPPGQAAGPPGYPGQPVYPGQPEPPPGPPGYPPQQGQAQPGYPPAPGQGWPGYPAPADPYAQPTSGTPYNPGPGGDPYAQPTSGTPYAPPPPSGPPYQGPVSGQPYQPGQPYPTSGQPYPTSGQPYSPAPGGPYPPPGQPYSPAPGQTSGFPAAGQTSGFPVDPFTGAYQQGFAPPPPPKKKRGLMITLIVVAIVVVLGGGGGAAAYLVSQQDKGTGQASPTAAVNEFLKAVFKDKNADQANKYVCLSARDSQTMSQRIEDIRKYDAALKEPAYTWPEPVVENQNKERATLTVPIKVTTTDDRVAETKLKFLTTNDDGWWVCEITAG